MDALNKWAHDSAHRTGPVWQMLGLKLMEATRHSLHALVTCRVSFFCIAVCRMATLSLSRTCSSVLFFGASGCGDLRASQHQSLLRRCGCCSAFDPERSTYYDRGSNNGCGLWNQVMFGWTKALRDSAWTIWCMIP